MSLQELECLHERVLALELNVANRIGARVNKLLFEDYTTYYMGDLVGCELSRENSASLGAGSAARGVCILHANIGKVRMDGTDFKR